MHSSVLSPLESDRRMHGVSKGVSSVLENLKYSKVCKVSRPYVDRARNAYNLSFAP